MNTSGISSKPELRKVADELKRHATLDTADLAGRSAIEHRTLYSGAANEQSFAAFVVAALSQITRRVDELEKQLADGRKIDEGTTSSSPKKAEGTASQGSEQW